MTKIVIIQGHPDLSGKRFCHAIAQSYIEGAEAAGHNVELVEVAALDFPLLASQDDWQTGADGTPPDLQAAQAACVASDHLVFVYPLWLGTMPALLKGFLEQTFRPGIALSYGESFPAPLFKGKSTRVIITMGMPALIYNWYFFAHSLKSLERNILRFIGMSPVRSSIIGSVESMSHEQRLRWLERVRNLGGQAA